MTTVPDLAIEVILDNNPLPRVNSDLYYYQVGYSMEVDRAEEGPVAGNIATSPRHIIAPVDDEHPFDLDGYISNYSGEPLKDKMT